LGWIKEASIGADILPSATGCGSTPHVGGDGPGVPRQGASKRDSAFLGGNTISETVTNCGSAGGGVAIMLTLYELGKLWVGIHSSRCRGQS